MNLQLGVDVFDVVAHGLRADEKVCGNFFGIYSVGNQRQDLQFAGCKCFLL